MPHVFVQQVTVTWTKASRRGSGAAQRNRVARGYAWPSAAACFHDVRVQEREGFRPISDTAEEVHMEVSDLLSLRLVGDRLSLLPQADPWGMPRRHRRPPRTAIATGEWVRWSMNYRFGLEQGCLYKLSVWNVAYAEGPLGELFTQVPVRDIEELATVR